MTLLPAIAMIEESVVFGRYNSRLQEMRYYLEHPQDKSIVMLFQQFFITITRSPMPAMQITKFHQPQTSNKNIKQG
jgi:hypothetical protein